MLTQRRSRSISNGMKLFNLIVIVIFVALALVSVFIFATYTSFQKQAVGVVSIWGTYPQNIFDTMLGELGKSNDTYNKVSYRSIPEDQLVPDLVEAIAAGNGPDLVVFPAADIVSQGNKLQSIPYGNLSKRTFDDSFIQAGEVFLASDGVKGIPFTVDPLVMYWNRTLFSNAGIASPPRYWDELTDMAPKLTHADKNGTLTQSAVALGAWGNIDHAKSIFLTLADQLGNTVITSDGKGGYRSTLSDAGTGAVNPVDSALRFYTDFADPVKPVYSWNSAEPDSRSAFVAGTLAVYFGTASELPAIRAANPNLNFDVANVPAVRGGGSGVAADVTALAVPRGSRNPQGALVVAEALTSNASEQILTSMYPVPSVRRDAPPAAPGDAYGTMFRNAALVSFSFLDPDPSSTDSIFKRMIENVTSGKLQVSDATLAAHQELNALLGVQ